jgi:hypothetical protein
MQSLDVLVNPERLYSRGEVLVNPSPIPKTSGIYAWYFKETPTQVPVDDCVDHNGSKLLYVGISPKKPSRTSKPSTQTLWHRIRSHYRGNAEGSTLRLTLGCLLSDQLEIELRRVGSGKRMTFHSGEEKISNWMEINAFVTWVSHDEPWKLEDKAIKELSLPLNLKDNIKHRFHRTLSSVRRSKKRTARAKPIVN